MKFSLDQSVTICVSGETGLIIGRAEFLSSGPKYLVRYQCADGRAVENWWDEDALN